MSVEHMAVVLHHSAAIGTEKVVMLGIANHEGDGGAWPTIATLARYCNVDPRSVQRAIRARVEDGELAEVQRPGKSTMYRVLVTCPAECSGGPAHRMAEAPTNLRRWSHQAGSPDAHVGGSSDSTPDVDVTPDAYVGGDADVAPGVTPTSPHPRRPRHPRGDVHVTQTINEPSENHQGTITARDEPDGDTLALDLPAARTQVRAKATAPAKADPSAFDAFWRTYPRRDSKPAALRAWQRAIRDATPEEITAGAARYRDDPNRSPSFTKLPATWLNGDCWNDDPLPPRGDRQPGGATRVVATNNHQWTQGDRFDDAPTPSRTA